MSTSEDPALQFTSLHGWCSIDGRKVFERNAREFWEWTGKWGYQGKARWEVFSIEYDPETKKNVWTPLFFALVDDCEDPPEIPIPGPVYYDLDEEGMEDATVEDVEDATVEDATVDDATVEDATVDVD